MIQNYDAFRDFAAVRDPASVAVTNASVRARCMAVATRVFALPGFDPVVGGRIINTTSRTCNTITNREAEVLGGLHRADEARLRALTDDALDFVYRGNTDNANRQANTSADIAGAESKRQRALARMRFAMSGLHQIVANGPVSETSPHGYDEAETHVARDLTSRCAMGTAALLFAVERTGLGQGITRDFLRSTSVTMGAVLTSLGMVPAEVDAEAAREAAADPERHIAQQEA